MNHIEYNYLCSGYIFLKAMLTIFIVLKYRSLMQQFQRHYWDVLLLCNLDRHIALMYNWDDKSKILRSNIDN